MSDKKEVLQENKLAVLGFYSKKPVHEEDFSYVEYVRKCEALNIVVTKEHDYNGILQNEYCELEIEGSGCTTTIRMNGVYNINDLGNLVRIIKGE